MPSSKNEESKKQMQQNLKEEEFEELKIAKKNYKKIGTSL
jgi:hypothetical protein